MVNQRWCISPKGKLRMEWFERNLAGLHTTSDLIERDSKLPEFK